jgi:RNA polymerase sigma factor (TIGR02999 family)
MELAYAELHEMAVGQCRREPPGGTLQATALLHEACIRLIQAEMTFKNRRHFFGSASKAMRRTLVDGARRRHAHKRGGQWQRVDFAYAREVGFERPGELLDFDLALERLEAINPLWGEVTELRVFGGWSTCEVATILGIGASTARRHWTSAKCWLRAALTPGAAAHQGNAK